MRYTAEQVKMLDAVGELLKLELIDFDTATELRDQVRAGRVDQARAALYESTGTFVQVVNSLEIKYVTRPTRNQPKPKQKAR